MSADVVDLMLGHSVRSTGLINRLYPLISEISGSLELAYQRGYQAGQNSVRSEKGD